MTAPPRAGSDMAYAVHTHTCTYLLDEDGICCWIVSQRGLVPPHVRPCIGAQFVACLDLAEEGGLVGELRIGARALFVQYFEDRMVLLRTGPIQAVDDRRATPERGPPRPVGADPTVVSQYGKRSGIPYPNPPPRFGRVKDHGEERSVTVSFPGGRWRR
jgi:hypothetical protein